MSQIHTPSELDREAFDYAVSLFDLESKPASIQMIQLTLSLLAPIKIQSRLGYTEHDLRAFFSRQPNCFVWGNMVMQSNPKIIEIEEQQERQGGENFGTSIPFSGTVTKLGSVHGVLKMDSGQEVYFNTRDCFRPGANLNYYFHKGQRVYFDLSKGPKRAKYKLVACRVTTVAPATPAILEKEEIEAKEEETKKKRYVNAKVKENSYGNEGKEWYPDDQGDEEDDNCTTETGEESKKERYINAEVKGNSYGNEGKEWCPDDQGDEEDDDYTTLDYKEPESEEEHQGQSVRRKSVERNSVSSSGTVTKLWALYGVLKTDSGQEVYFNRRDCSPPLLDANLKEYFHKGQRVYFDLSKGPRRDKYNWVACRVTTVAPVTPAILEVPTNDESSAVIELELLKYLIVEALECQSRTDGAVPSALPKFPRSLPTSSIMAQKFPTFFSLKDERLSLKQIPKDSSWTQGKATVISIGLSSALAERPDGELVYFIRSALYLRNTVVAKGKLATVLVVGDVLSYIAVPYQMHGSMPTIQGAKDAKFQAVLAWQWVFDRRLSERTDTSVNAKGSEDSHNSEGALRSQGAYKSDCTQTSEVPCTSTSMENKACNIDKHDLVNVKCTQACQTISTGAVVMMACTGTLP